MGLLLDLPAQLIYLCQRPLRHDGEESRVLGQDFKPLQPQRVVHQLKLLDRFGELGFVVAHNSILSTPFVAYGDSRVWLSKRTYFQYNSELSSATRTSKPNRRRKRLFDSRALSLRYTRYTLALHHFADEPSTMLLRAD